MAGRWLMLGTVEILGGAASIFGIGAETITWISGRF
jgi:hypothetical protein